MVKLWLSARVLGLEDHDFQQVTVLPASVSSSEMRTIIYLPNRISVWIK